MCQKLDKSPRKYLHKFDFNTTLNTKSSPHYHKITSKYRLN